ncbi:GntR family transcriptional regulator [Alicyclobacillus sp. SO9]|uniref:GntR family transcriptional regulator n=1 Tax=Alicyclobacillus sp. SO9 TaxID=2665646 RepID=UPI0018E81DA8|nr:GntR family transcriptional regulator [Alicyclobacillus sp. SO9]QQE79237.1 GntR family transcriptional regulator [Alicyclobacillus sp. SO9]
MDICLDINSDVPIYLQIRNQIILGIARNSLRPDESLPSTRQLGADFGINFHTVNKAYDLLAKEGVIKMSRKMGAVVSVEPRQPDFPDRWLENAEIWLSEALVKGMSPQEVVAQCKAIVERVRNTHLSESEE